MVRRMRLRLAGKVRSNASKPRLRAATKGANELENIRTSASVNVLTAILSRRRQAARHGKCQRGGGASEGNETGEKCLNYLERSGARGRLQYRWTQE